MRYLFCRLLQHVIAFSANLSTDFGICLNGSGRCLNMHVDLINIDDIMTVFIWSLRIYWALENSLKYKINEFYIIFFKKSKKLQFITLMSIPHPYYTRYNKKTLKLLCFWHTCEVVCANSRSTSVYLVVR